jgi:hypothetical protein
LARALPATAILRFLLPDRLRVGPSVMTGLPVTTWSLATIQFSKPPSPWPLGGAGPFIDLLGRANKNPLK